MGRTPAETQCLVAAAIAVIGELVNQRRADGEMLAQVAAMKCSVARNRQESFASGRM